MSFLGQQGHHGERCSDPPPSRQKMLAILNERLELITAIAAGMDRRRERCGRRQVFLAARAEPVDPWSCRRIAESRAGLQMDIEDRLPGVGTAGN